MSSSQWRQLSVCGDLNLQQTLSSGQAFRWQCVKDGMWLGEINQCVFALKAPNHSTLSYLTLHTSHLSQETPAEILTDYFRLLTDLAQLYSSWSCDPNFRLKSSGCKGVRLLRQYPLENVVSFICSSNNNISRISQMINKLCHTFGDPLCCYGDVQLYGFPSLEKLCSDDTEDILRGLGFGYRAKYVAKATKEIAKRGGNDWLYSLREKPYREVWTSLQTLPGVGSKVADCVAMMSLDKLEAVPVDTHILAVAMRDYGLYNKGKSLTASVYRHIGDHFRSIFGAQAGWATTVLFVADVNKTNQSDDSVQKPGTHQSDKRTDQLDCCVKNPATHQSDKGIEKTDQSDCSVKKPETHQSDKSIEKTDQSDCSVKKPATHQSDKGIEKTHQSDCSVKKPETHQSDKSIEKTDQSDCSVKKPETHQKDTSIEKTDQSDDIIQMFKNEQSDCSSHQGKRKKASGRRSQLKKFKT